ncbi:Fer-1-like protein 6 [Larimichthys crocea]|uniref:Fer-1-like protein 6 n=1 Tax=Larimichthys crocea TaxID=215358 RepID=A0A6G0J851_LARCR|nr:Fer-1-like protein 6 [Larimichthys crocea]
MDNSDSPATKQRKAKHMFGLKVKKKKKVNTDLVMANKGALESEVEVTSEVSILVEGESIDDQPGPSAIKTRIIPNNKRAKLKTRIQRSEGKPQSFQIAINITEARQLVGENIDPSIVIEIGDEKKQTSVKEGTNAPFYNEYFVFDFFALKEVFFDKVIKLTVMHSKMLRSFCVGSFKLDVWTVYKQPGHQFVNKWAMLTNPGDISTGVKGYVKCDISVSAKGDAMQPGPKASDADEQIDKNLLIPEGFPAERPWARFSVKVYQAEGLPRNNSSIMANVTKAFIGDNTALIDPYVVVSFFKRVGRTSTQKSTADPVWNEQIVFTEMFPPLCQRLKIQVWDEGSMNDVAIGTHYFDLRRISNEQDGDRGFLPTFGPAWINLYGSARNFTLGDDTAELNEGIGEGVSYRGRVYMELAVEILSGGTGSESKLAKKVKPVKDAKAGKAGGKDGKTPAGGGAGAAAGGAADDDKAAAEVLPVESPPALSADKERFLLFGTLFEATMIDRKIGDKPISFEFSLGNYGNVLEPTGQPGIIPPSPSLSRRRKALDVSDSDAFGSSPLSTSPTSPASPLLPREPQEPISTPKSVTPPEKPLTVEGNRGFIAVAEAKLKAGLKSSYLTQLDKKRLTMCKQELESMIGEAQSMVERKGKVGGVKEMLQTATKLTHKLRFLVEEPQHTVPDVFVWLLSNNKRVACARVRTRDLLFSNDQEAKGIHCGKIITLYLRPPGKRVAADLSVQAKLDVYLWFGISSDSNHMLDNIPEGFFPATGGADANNPPTYLNGIGDQSDPQSNMESVFTNEQAPTERDLQHIQQEPPRILIEVYDDDALGKAEYLGTTVAVPEVRLSSEPYSPPTLQYSPLHCGSQSGGDLLAAFELLQIPESGEQNLLPLEEQYGGIYRVPANIRPVLSTYRLEVLFWGLRELKKVQFLSVDRPQVFIECAGKTLRSSVIQKYKSSPNFTTLVDVIELELPENEHLHPPLSITVVDWRAFGPSQHPGETSSTVALTNQDFLITVDDEPPPPAPKTPKKEPKKKRDKAQDSSTKTVRSRSTKRRRRTIADESAASVIDWWSKYYASVEKQAKQRDSTPFSQSIEKALPFQSLLSDGIDSLVSPSDGDKKKKQKGKGILEANISLPTKLAALQLYSKELEVEFGPFDDWVNTYELFRGKATEEDGPTEERFVGKFKGRFCLYKQDEDLDGVADGGQFKVNRGIPPNSPVQVIIRIYIVSVRSHF